MVLTCPRLRVWPGAFSNEALLKYKVLCSPNGLYDTKPLTQRLTPAQPLRYRPMYQTSSIFLNRGSGRRCQASIRRELTASGRDFKAKLAADSDLKKCHHDASRYSLPQIQSRPTSGNLRACVHDHLFSALTNFGSETNCYGSCPVHRK